MLNLLIHNVFTHPYYTLNENFLFLFLNFQLFAIIVFGCISSQGRIPDKDGKDYCLYNGNPNACNYGVGIGVIAFLASMGFLAGEYLFEQMSSVKTRKHFVLGDLGFSSKEKQKFERSGKDKIVPFQFIGLWAFLFFVGFCYLSNQWGKADDPPNGVGVNNVQAAIVFSLFSAATWVIENNFGFHH